MSLDEFDNITKYVKEKIILCELCELYNNIYFIVYKII